MQFSASVTLPTHIVLQIFAFLSPDELALVGGVNAAWRQCANHPALWQQKCVVYELDCGPGYEDLLAQLNGDTGLWWKSRFQRGFRTRRNWATARYQLSHTCLPESSGAPTW